MLYQCIRVDFEVIFVDINGTMWVIMFFVPG